MATAPPVRRTTSIGSTPPALLERLVGIGLERNLAAAAQALVGGDDELDFASSMRPASESGEKPPNTTEWMAPMRAQASMA